LGFDHPIFDIHAGTATSSFTWFPNSFNMILMKEKLSIIGLMKSKKFSSN
jgi:hypothetical protein